MATGVFVPRWGVTMEQATVVAWLAAEGAGVARGQDLVELETEKMANVVEAPADGVLRVVLVPEGEVAAVGDLLGVIGGPDEPLDLEALRGAAPDLPGASAPASRGREARPPGRTARGRVRASPAARRLAADHGIDLAAVAGTGPEGSLRRQDVEGAVVEAVARSRDEGYVTTSFGRLHYVAAGGPSTGLRCRDLPVVLVHGLGGTTHLWQANLTALAARHRVVAVDLPGHGLSDRHPAPYGVDLFARAVSELLAAMDLGPVALVGHSLGGHACLKVALDTPGAVAKLVLVDSGGLGPEIDTGFLEPLLSGPDREAVEAMLRGLFCDPSAVTRPMVDAALEALARPGAWEALREAVWASTDRGRQAEVLLERLGELPMPVLVVWGGEDEVIPRTHGDAARDRIPAARLWVADGAGHCPQIEAGGRFNERVLAFLA